MRKIIVQEFITLDGVMQAPGGPDEDTSSDFKYGGWTAPYFGQADEEAGEFMVEWMRSTDILLGRKTFDIFANYWPEHEDMWPGINDVTKYVMSTSLDASTWNNTTFLKNVDELKKIKESEGGDIKVHGSGALAQELFKYGLVDELSLITYPLILGKGKRLFGEDSTPTAFRLTKSVASSNGVIFAKYERAGDVETGTVGA
jgi:dihydrofolate reductase